MIGTSKKVFGSYRELRLRHQWFASMTIKIVLS